MSPMPRQLCVTGDAGNSRHEAQVMYRLFRLTGEPDFAAAAARFDKPAFWAPLLAGADPLPGLHANTHLAQARRGAVQACPDCFAAMRALPMGWSYSTRIHRRKSAGLLLTPNLTF